MENITVEDLKEVEFHDSTLLSLKIDFDNKWIEAEVELIYDEPKLTIQFSDFKNISLGEIEELDDCEINDVDFKPVISTKRTEVTFVLLLGFGHRCSELKFTFSDLKARFSDGVETFDELQEIWSKHYYKE
ncbi:hypothetical protein SapgrDRAFT_2985 [Saprospira grandis DSM 2844]|uniref:Uncharacterized protein n=1 Tax=Saprospira grandis DSM 2844 TaxID=694433 RepID=J0P475_9BACT|nr:hypothetical protein SapgrDRAFT_2985 [Saprospira grandis DSM 2844]